MPEDGPIKIGESPYRRSVKVEKVDAENFEICQGHERVISRLPFRKKFQYIHLNKDDDGSIYFNLLVTGSGEPEFYRLPVEENEVEEEGD